MNKIIFFGTSDFAVPSLRALAQDPNIEIIGVVTQPDRPVGRHAVLTAPPIKVAAQELGIPVIQQPEKIKEEAFSTWLKEVGPSCEVFIVVSYGKILPQWLLDLPRKGVLNVHGSLLPLHRGASPIQAAIAAGDAKSGVSIMLLDADMDHGPVLATAEDAILPEDTGGTLHDRLATLGGETLPMVLQGYLNGSLKPAEQDHSHATYCKQLQREDGKLDPTKTVEELERLVRAYNPWPGTWIEFEGSRLKIFATSVSPNHSDQKPETYITENGTPCIVCANGSVLQLLSVQPEGKKAMSGQDFIRGSREWKN